MNAIVRKNAVVSPAMTALMGLGRTALIRLILPLSGIFAIVLLLILPVLPVRAATIFELAVQASSDDCTNREVTPEFSTLSYNHIVGDYNASYYDRSSGLCFDGVTVPAGSTITEAHIEVYASLTCTVCPVTTYIDAEDTGDANTYSNKTDFDSRSYTGNPATWTISTWYKGNWYDSPDLKTSVQAVVNRGDWVSGNAMAFEHYHASGYAGTKKEIEYYSWNYSDSSYAPVLHIEYEEAGPATPPTGVTSFTLSWNEDDSILAEWTLSASANGTRLVRDWEEYPVDRDDPILVYEGTDTDYTDNFTLGLPHNIAEWKYGIWEYNDTGWSDAVYASIGTEGGLPEDMEISIPNNVILILIAGFAIFLAYWIRSYFCKIMAGFLTIAAGIYQIIVTPDEWAFIIVGTVIISIGVYIMIMVAVDLVKGGN